MAKTARPIIPVIEVPGDTADRLMARDGALMGLTKTRALWRFGYLSGSDHAQAHNIWVNEFVWVIADHSGETLGSFTGMALDLPKRFADLVGFEIG